MMCLPSCVGNIHFVLLHTLDSYNDGMVHSIEID